MKNFKSILTLGMLFVSTAGFAQFANNGGSHSSGGGSALIKDTKTIHAFTSATTPPLFPTM